MNADPIKVLLVEDNRGDARLLQEALAEAGRGRFQLVQVERLGDALQLLHEEGFDVILLDLRLPDSEGLDTIVRTRQQAQGVPIVVLTGISDEELAIKAVQKGAQDYLFKGRVETDLLVRAVRYAIERQHSQERIHYQAYHDALTDLPNRTLFHDRLEQAMAQARRRGQLLALHLVDLDRFKEINDTLGHVVGDELLKGVAHRLQRTVRASDTVARLGSDEFAVIQTELNDVQGAAVLAQKAIDALARPFRLGDREVRTGAAIGIAVFPSDGTEAAQFLQNADLALDAGKAKGQNTYEFFDPEVRAALKARKKLEEQLHRALAGNQFTVHFQPQVELASGRFVGVEALVRWRHPDRGIVSPNEFIPVAESTGLIRPLGEWVLRAACAQMRVWQDAGLSPSSVAVNLSAGQLNGGDFVATVTDALDSSRLAPGQLELEITETMIMHRRDLTIGPQLEQLHELGVRISVDDFGTGYGSLPYLKRFPVSKVKIDQSFVQGIGRDADDEAIIEAVIGLGRSLNMTVVAEGVETNEQFAFLKAEGCHQAQGYYFGRPLPARELTALLKVEAFPALDGARAECA